MYKKLLKLAHYFKLNFRITKALSNGNSQNFHLNINEVCFISLTSKLLTYLIDNFTLQMKSHSKAYLSSRSEHMYWIWALKLRCTQYGFCGRPSGVQGQLYLKWGGAANIFQLHSKKIMRLPKGWRLRGPALSYQWTPSLKAYWGVLELGVVHS